MAIAPNWPLLTFPTIDPRSALSAAADLGEVAVAVGRGGAAGRRAGFFAAFRVGFFAARFRAEVVCFFLVAVCEVDSIGATASAASRITARALSLR
jgi:hypothetical protein